ncbi:hypothetical protein [Streptosporangium sp. NPDC000396]|uniref:hypothetical protein n=1 Tax=Streptosporangium sp. NPDC000396 TaxID=3366185 RepID=UPI0036B3E5AE
MSETNVVAFNPDRPRCTRRPKPSIPAGTPLPALLGSWQLTLEAQKKADPTIYLYTRTARAFITFLEKNGLPCDAESVTEAGALHTDSLTLGCAWLVARVLLVTEYDALVEEAVKLVRRPARSETMITL